MTISILSKQIFGMFEELSIRICENKDEIPLSEFFSLFCVVAANVETWNSEIKKVQKLFEKIKIKDKKTRLEFFKFLGKYFKFVSPENLSSDANFYRNLIEIILLEFKSNENYDDYLVIMLNCLLALINAIGNHFLTFGQLGHFWGVFELKGNILESLQVLDVREKENQRKLVIEISELLNSI